MTKPPTVVFLQYTNNSAYILDPSGWILSQVREHSVGFQLSDFMEENTQIVQSEHNTSTKVSVIDTLVIKGVDFTQGKDDGPTYVKDQDSVIQCYGYNLTLADNNNGTMIEAVNYDSCGGSTLRSFIIGKPSQFRNLKGIYLEILQINELTVKDFMDFPELQTLYLLKIPIEHMENGLFCHNLNITILHYVNSFGYLKLFPYQIFNCTNPLKLEYVTLEGHNIASLPTHAFGSAAEHLRVLRLWNISLEVIHIYAFSGLMNLQLLSLRGNRLQQVPGEIGPPSTHLQVIEYKDDRLNGTLNLTAMHVERKNYLQMFVWSVASMSNVEGSFCSNQSNSELKMIRLKGNISFDRSNFGLEKNCLRSKNHMIETLPPNVFDHCRSLQFLSITSTGLAYLPDRLFYTNVSKLESLSLADNRLNNNMSWSDILMDLHELKHLNLSMNMLTFWTYKLSSLWNLEILDLSHNVITEISHKAFMKMTKLNFLSLEDNNLVFLAPEVILAFEHIPQLNLGSNNIYQLNMSTNTLLSNTIVIDMSANNLNQLDLPPERNCIFFCGEISLFGDNNNLSWFVLPCPNTHQYAKVSLTNNTLTDINSLFPNVLVQQCSVETLNVSGNYFKSWSSVPYMPFKYKMDRIYNQEKRIHLIRTLDMTHCRMEFIEKEVFLVFSIGYLDLRQNARHTLPSVFYDPFYPFPRALNVQFNPIICNCHMLWLKQYLNATLQRKNEILVSNCTEPLWNTSRDIQALPDIMFICDTKCPQQIYHQCDKGSRCYQRHSDSDINVAVCLSSNNNELSPAFNTVLYQLYVSGFNLSTLKLPYMKPHNLTHLNLTSCNISEIPETAFNNTLHLEVLVLAHNAIKTLAAATLYPLTWLKYLDLSNNQLLSFDAELFLPLFLLETVHLHENKLQQLSLETLEELKMLEILSLYDNPWICDCNNTFGHWIVEQQIKGMLQSPKNITCGRSDVPVMLFNKTCITHIEVAIVHPGAKAAIVVSSVLASVLAVILVVCILIYKHRHTLSVLAFIYMPRFTRRRTDNDDVRGVFAIYDDQESGARIMIRESLIPFIECACPLICYDRDFIIGEDMADNIQNAVERSNCAIVLLSRRFMQNSWSCCMFQAAFSEMRERKRPYKIILILTPDVTVNLLTSHENCPQDLRILLKTQRLVDMSQSLYHETLLYLLPDSCTTAQQFMTVRGKNIITTFYELQIDDTTYVERAVKSISH